MRIGNEPEQKEIGIAADDVSSPYDDVDAVSGSASAEERRRIVVFG